jgi:phosphonopyruvate decarboxylase
VIEAGRFIAAARARNFGLYTGVPCSYLQPFINFVLDDPGLRYIAAANEGHAVAIASGAQLGGVRSVVMIQNSGLGNTVSPLTSLNQVFQLPVLLIVTLRGEPGGPADEPQHALMGPITTRLLELMDIPWGWFPTEADAIERALERAVEVMGGGRPFALVMRKGSVAPHTLRSQAVPQAIPAPLPPFAWPAPRPLRHMILAALQGHRTDDILIATTGYTGRELYSLADLSNQFYMVGSMGCASSLGLGLASARPRQRIVVIDGDGAALMHLGAFATIGQQQPQNLIHVLLDNETYESTGGQASSAQSVDLAAVARACGYPTVLRLETGEALRDVMAGETKGPLFIHIKIAPGTAGDLPRPAITPAAAARRFEAWIGSQA